MSESSIDRYLCGIAASRRERNQVDGRLAALALYMFNRVRSQTNLHKYL